MLRFAMAKGLTRSPHLTLLRSFLVAGLAAPGLALVAGTSPVLAQPAFSSSDQVDAPAADEPQVLISEVVVVGVEDHPDRERLERAVYDSLTIRPGSTTSRTALKADLDAIYATGWFSDVRVQPSDSPLGVRLVVTVDPNPVLSEVVLNEPDALLPKAD